MLLVEHIIKIKSNHNGNFYSGATELFYNTFSPFAKSLFPAQHKRHIKCKGLKLYSTLLKKDYFTKGVSLENLPTKHYQLLWQQLYLYSDVTSIALTSDPRVWLQPDQLQSYYFQEVHDLVLIPKTGALRKPQVKCRATIIFSITIATATTNNNNTIAIKSSVSRIIHSSIVSYSERPKVTKL